MTKEILIDSVIVTDRVREAFGDLTSLKESIEAIGLINPIVLNSKMELITGGRRLEAVRQLGRDYIKATITDDYDELMMACLAERDENTCRLDWSPSEKLAFAAKLGPIERASAKARQREHAGTTHGKPKVTSGKLPGVTSSHGTNYAKDRVANVLGWSRHTLDRAQKIKDATKSSDPDEAKLAAELMANVDSTGNVSGNYAKLKAFRNGPQKPPSPPPQNGDDAVSIALRSSTQFDDWCKELRKIRMQIEKFAKDKTPGSSYLIPAKITSVLKHACELIAESKPYAKCHCGHICAQCNDSGYVNKSRHDKQREGASNA